MADLNELSAQEIGRRLRLARENAGIRQDEAAEVIGMSRPTLCPSKRARGASVFRSCSFLRGTMEFPSTAFCVGKRFIPI